MAEYLINGETLTDIADAIRTKEGTTDPIAVSDFASRIGAIQAGGTEVTKDGHLRKYHTAYNVPFNFRTNSTNTACYLDIPNEYLPSDLYTGTTLVDKIFYAVVAEIKWTNITYRKVLVAHSKTIKFYGGSDTLDGEEFVYCNTSSSALVSYSSFVNDGAGGYSLKVPKSAYTEFGDGTGSVGDIFFVYESNDKYMKLEE